MRKRLIAAFLLVVAAIVLGSTVFREQVVNAATTPFQNVVVTEHEHESDPGHASRHVDDERERNRRHRPEQEHRQSRLQRKHVNLDSTDSGHLANIESTVGKLNFDSSGNLETTAQTASPGAVTEQCTDGGSSGWDITHDSEDYPLCSGQDFYVTDVTGSGMDDNIAVDFMYNGNTVLELLGSGINGADSYQLDLTHPIHVDEIDASCNNASSDCNFSLAVLGNSTGN